MTWLKKRLKELEMTHQDLTDILNALGVDKSRPTISNWVNGQPIPLFMSPEQTVLLAEALQWSVSELLISAGYPIAAQDIPPEIATYVPRFRLLSPDELKIVVETVDFGMGLLEHYNRSRNHSDQGSDTIQDS